MRCFLFYIDDWLSSKHIQRMDAHEERGYLRLLLDAANSDDCGIPDDDAELAVISLLGGQWYKPTKDKSRRLSDKTSGQKIRECFTFQPEYAHPGRLYNERLYREWLHQKEVAMSRAAAGRLGGRPRKPIAFEAEKQMVKQTESKAKANGKQKETNDVCVYVSSSSEFNVADFTERLYAVSRKRKHKILAEQAMVDAISNGKIGPLGISFSLVESRWKAANETESWLWKNGANAQTLAEWIVDGNYRYEVVSQPSTPEEEKPIDRYADLRHLPPDEMQHQIGIRERAEYDALVAQNAKRRGAA